VTAALAFVFAMTFSPGPNNIMSASLGMMHGYQKALRFILGVVCGFAVDIAERWGERPLQEPRRRNGECTERGDGNDELAHSEIVRSCVSLPAAIRETQSNA
jgi:hypothetical protein